MPMTISRAFHESTVSLKIWADQLLVAVLLDENMSKSWPRRWAFQKKKLSGKWSSGLGRTASRNDLLGSVFSFSYCHASQIWFLSYFLLIFGHAWKSIRYLGSLDFCDFHAEGIMHWREL